jgi:hypothetical protein
MREAVGDCLVLIAMIVWFAVLPYSRSMPMDLVSTWLEHVAW